jgi:L-amino acid N-acyltransferase YncA
VRLRLASGGDASRALAIYAPVVRESWISFEDEPPSVGEFRARIERVLERSPWFVATEGDELLGYAYADRVRARAAYQWFAETTVYVHPAAHRRGVGRALYGALLAALRIQGYASAWAGIALPNPGSVALHEAVGFRPAGVWSAVGYKLGAWRDVGWWRLDLQDLGPSPVPPRSLAAAMAMPAWEAAGLPAAAASP